METGARDEETLFSQFFIISFSPSIQALLQNEDHQTSFSWSPETLPNLQTWSNWWLILSLFTAADRSASSSVGDAREVRERTLLYWLCSYFFSSLSGSDEHSSRLPALMRNKWPHITHEVGVWWRVNWMYGAVEGVCVSWPHLSQQHRLRKREHLIHYHQ